jgi:hypothetical protein
MRSSFVSYRGGPLTKTPNVRQQTSRRLGLVLGVMAAFALGSALIGAATTRADGETETPRTGPFSYLSEQ